jgi:hypothetical protein
VEVSKTLDTPSFVGFKTLVVVFFSFFVFRKTNHNNRPNKEVVGNPKSSSMAECLVAKLANKGFVCTLRKPSLLLVYLLIFLLVALS